MGKIRVTQSISKERIKLLDGQIAFDECHRCNTFQYTFAGLIAINEALSSVRGARHSSNNSNSKIVGEYELRNEKGKSKYCLSLVERSF